MLITLFIDVVSVLPAFMEQSAFLASTPRCVCVRICVCVCPSITLSFSSPCISFFPSFPFISLQLFLNFLLFLFHSYLTHISYPQRSILDSTLSKPRSRQQCSLPHHCFHIYCPAFPFLNSESPTHRHNHMWHTKPLTSHSQLGDV